MSVVVGIVCVGRRVCVWGSVYGTVFNICFEIYIHDQEARTSGGKKHLRNMRTHIMIHIELDGGKNV